MTKSVRIGAKSSFLLVLSASVLYAIGVQGIRSGPGPSSFDGLASLFGVERRAESDRIQSPAADMTVGEPALSGLAPAVAEASEAMAPVAVPVAAPVAVVAPPTMPVSVAPAAVGPSLAPVRAPLAQDVCDEAPAFASVEASLGESSVDLPAVGPLASVPGLMAPADITAESTTVTFQQGVSGYTAAFDTFIQYDGTANNAGATTLTADGPTPDTDIRQILIRFDDIFGAGPDQIPPGATILSATLAVNVSNGIAIATNFHRLLNSWADSNVWSTFGSSPWNATAGVQADGVDAVATADAAPGSIAAGAQAISVTTSLQAWSDDPASNFGWALLVAGPDSLVFESSEASIPASRPKLTVQYLPPGVESLTFQDGASGYASTQDAHIQENSPGTNFGSAETVKWDSDEPSSSAKYSYGLIRFDNLFGNGASQIPVGSTIESATLTIYITNITNASASLNEVAVTWDETAVTWNTFGALPGVDAADYGALVGSVPLGTANTPADIDVTSSLTTWANNPSANLGWIIRPATTDGQECASSEATTQTQRPKLTVYFTPPTITCSTDGECSNGLYCDGVETCPAGTCVPGTAPICADAFSCTTDACNESADTCDHIPNHAGCNDGNVCTDDSCDPLLGDPSTGCIHQNNTVACTDGNNCTNPDVCVGGACVSGSPVACNDNVACTNDSCVAPSGCQYADACTGGTVCNHSSGLCEAPSYQQLPIELGEAWRYFKGTTEPSTPIQWPPLWAAAGFDDTVTGWTEGLSGFGYGSRCTTQTSTTLSDMLNGYVSLYMRKKFYVPDPSAIYGLQLTMYYDDGFVVYLNGQEVARTNVTGTPPTNLQLATTNHDCTGAEVFSIDRSKLVAGVNVIAIQGHNLTSGSSDFTMAPVLETLAPPNLPPAQPTNPSPADGSVSVTLAPDLCVDVSDPEGQPLNVTFYGREMTGVAGDPFTIVVLPDPQNYAASYPSIYNAQTQWCADNRVARNIVQVIGLGDMTNDASLTQWGVADTAFDTLDAVPLPYGMCVGNHDQNPSGTSRVGSDEGATTVNYNSTFPKSRIQALGYPVGNYTFGGAYPNNMDNYYQLFTAGGMDFIVFYLEVDSMGAGYEGTCTSATCLAVVQWVDDLLTNTYPDRRAIIVSHALMQPSGTPPAFMNHGQVLYDAFKDNPNVFLMMTGHLDQANHRADTFDIAGQPHTIYTLIADYQSRSNGGNGWLRILTFDPQADKIHVETFSPSVVTGGRFINKPTGHGDNSPNDSCPVHTNPASNPIGQVCYVESGGTYAAGGNELMLPYDMEAGPPFVSLGTNGGVASGGRTCVSWPGRTKGTQYEWYVTVSDGNSATTGPRWDFTTATVCTIGSNECDDGLWCNGTETCPAGMCVVGTAPNCDDAIACTTDSCNETTDSCTHAASDAACADSNQCTDDICSTSTGCLNTPDDTNSCSDGDACTAPDSCSAGVCVPGMAMTCNDGLACTDDACVSPSGCEYVSNCEVGWRCNATTGICEEGCASDPDCDDGDACTTDTCGLPNAAALNFDGSNDYVTMGAAGGEAALGARAFTLEAWVKRDGANWGTVASTGTGGVSAVPIVTKGRGESDTGNLNCNYFLGIAGAGVLVADFEQMGAAGGWSDGQNHPACGTGTITDQSWHHVAVTYSTTDGWRIYIDGVEGTAADATSCTTCNPTGSCPRSPGVEPEYDSIQHFGLGTAMNSSGATEGFFAGMMDEARVWNRALTAVEIQANMHAALTSGDGLIGRWGLEEGTGTIAADSTAPAHNGTLTNGPAWITTDLPGLGDGTCSHQAVAGCCNTDPECADADSCTVDTCNRVSHTCEHVPTGECCSDADCNDDDVCTSDICNTGTNTCSHAYNTATCDDANACTSGEVCSAGICAGMAISCDDGNVCTDDSCSPLSGCLHANNTSTCDDQNACTTPDACSSGVCTGAYAPTPGCCSMDDDCDDGNGGTSDVCTAGSCSNEPSCTTDADCADADVCTTDTCNAANVAAVECDGTNDYINLGNDGNSAAVNYLTNFGTGSFTIEGWFRADSATTYMGLFRQGSQNVYPQVVVQFPGASPYNRIAGSIETSTSGTQVDATVLTQFTLGQWYHYAMVADRTQGAQSLTVYLHDATGVLVDSSSSPANVWSTYPINDTYTGTPPNEVRDPVVLGVARTPSPGPNYNYYFDGRLDEVRIWDHARTAQQIQENVGKQLESVPGLVHHWAMNEGMGTAVADSGSTQTAAGMLVNGPTWRTLASEVPVFENGTCVHADVPGCCNTDDECADADPCTVDVCNPGSHTCEHGPTGECCTAADCDDHNLCTDDTCNTGTNTCGHAYNTATCDDANACTSEDVCSAGTCAGTAISCDDGNVCTDDSCDVGTGCVHLSNTVACDDATVCNGHEVCSGGSCQAGTPPNCDDSDLCTTDSCDAVSGCHSVPMNCFDNDSCTLDSCVAGACEHSAIGCENETATGEFTVTTDAGEGATPADPMATTVTSPNAGTITIHEEALTAGAPPAGPGVTLMDLQAVVTAPPATAATPLHLVFRLDASSLPEGLVIETLVVYRNGTLVANCFEVPPPGDLSPDPCVSGRILLPDGDAQVEAWASAASTWTFGYLGCEGLADGTPCDDDDACTQTDTCQSEACVGSNPVVCTALDQCHNPGTCDTATGLCSNPVKADGTPCDDGLICNVGGTCQGGTCQGGAADPCDDSNPCTDDTCDAGSGCVHTPENANDCSDGNACNGLETCSAGTCVPGTALTCNDSLPCTDDSCEPASGCVFTPDDTNSCGDADICTIGEHCAGGYCVSSPTCNDGNVCTTDGCTGTNVNGYVLNFDGTEDYVTMGQALGLSTATFTLEAWIKRDSASWGNANATTGTGGLQNAVALITKGRSEGDSSNIDCNYFFGIDANGRLAADFEQYEATPWSAGQNHPICSTAQITDQNWHHVAVTYDKASGKGWKIYLDGVDVTAANGTSTICGSVSTCTDPAVCPQNPAVSPRYDSIQHAALGVALNSTGANPGGYFGGTMDEARTWNYARSVAEIQAGMYMQIPTATGLIGRWGLNDGSGATAADTALPAQNGTLTGATHLPVWTAAVDRTLGECSVTPIANCCVTAAECNDGNACTDDTCDANQCAHTTNTAPCSDGNACTSGDACSGGSCAGTPIPDCCQADAQCDDTNVCTTDSCNTANVAAIEVNGTNQYINLGNDGNTATLNYLTNFQNSDFTIEGWFWADTASAGYIGLFRGGRQSSNPQVVVQTAPSATYNRIAASVEAYTCPYTVVQVDVTSPTTFTTSADGVNHRWHHFALIVDRTIQAPDTTQVLRICLDGVCTSTDASLWSTYPIDMTAPPSPCTNPRTRDTSLLGVARDASGNPTAATYFDGRLDEVRIWNYAWSTTDFAAYKGKQVLSAPGLMHRWAMNEESGTTTADTGSTPTTNATLVNSPTWRSVAADIPLFGNDRCVHNATNEGGSCSDANPCTQMDTCQSGVCTGSNPVICVPLDQCHDAGDCQPGSGTCTDPAKQDGTPCDDDNPNTGNDVCTGGICVGGDLCTGVTCTALDQCHDAGVCDPQTGHCSNPPKQDGTTCDDGLYCTVNDACSSGSCTGAARDCADTNSCTTDTCEEGADQCVHDPIPLEGKSCEDGLYCSVGESCTIGICGNGQPLDCADANSCTADSCDEGAEQCVHDPAPLNGTTCDDDLYCTVIDTCTNGTCTGAPRNCSDGNSCTADSCDEGTGQCINDPAPLNGTACDDALYCTVGDTCSDGLCTSAARDCSGYTTQCTLGACNETADSCQAQPANEGGACDDGDICTGPDTCVGGICSGAPVANCCTSAAQCDDGKVCTSDICNPLNTAALNFDGSNDYVTMGQAGGESALGARAFTLESWIRKDGASWGAANASTGTGGLQNMVALITKGRSEADGTAQDCNYFFGITAAGRLMADFEQYAASGDGAGAGQNRPICSRAADGVITDGNWHHVAVTYSVTAGWKIYLDGADVTAANGLPATCGTESTCSNATYCVTNPAVLPRYDSTQHFGLGVALDTSGVPTATPGYFGGIMDEARVWNYARSAAEIQATRFVQIETAPGLIGRWGLNDGSSSPSTTTASDSTTSPTQNNGTLINFTLPGPWITSGLLDLSVNQCRHDAIAGCCKVDGDCADGVACTTDTCNVGTNTCDYTPSDVACDDGLYCNGAEACNPTTGCVAGTNPCADGVACTMDACNEAGDSCDHTPNDAPCNDHEYCNGVEICNPTTGCQAITVPNCDDASVCTTDECNSANYSAIETNGSSQYINLGNDGNTANVNYLTNFGTSSFTIEGWFYANGANSYCGILRHGKQGNSPQVVVQCPSASPYNRLALSVETTIGSNTTQVDTSNPPTFTLSAWHHFAMVVVRDLVTPANQRLNLYLDGVLAESTPASKWGTDTINDSLDGSANRYPVWLGVARGSDGNVLAGSYFNGRLDEVRVWDHARDATQISTNMNKQILAAPGLRHRWAMNEGSGTTTADTGSTPTAAATLVNSPAWRANPADIPGFGTNECTHAPTNEGGACDDGLACTTGDVCGGGSCSGTAVTCPDDGNVCNGPESCSPTTGQCVSGPALGDGTSCADSDLCDGTETCQAGVCTAGTAVTCPDDGNVCNGPESCSPTTGLCVSGPAPGDGTSCADGDLCDGTETCQAGVCTAGTPVTCTDALYCNGLETCDPALGCQPGTPPTCNDAIPCTVDSCNESTDSCVFTPQNSACDNGVLCDGTEVCDINLGCQTGTAPDCDDGVACTADSCTEQSSSYVCVHADTCLTGTHCDAYLNACISNGAHLTLPTSVSTATGGDVLVPITATTIDGVIAMDLAFTYDPALFRATAVWKTPLTEPASLTYNLGIPGKVDISLFHSSPLAGSGTIFWVSLEALGSAGGTTPLHWTEHSLNEGGVPSTSADGSAQVVGCTVQLSMPDDGLGVAGGEAVIPVIARPAAGLGIDLTVEFNPDQLQVLGVTTTPLSAGAILNFNENVPGKLLISIARTTEFSGEGPIADIRFGVKGGAPQESPVYLTRGSIDEGQVTSCLDAGVLETCAIDCNDENYCTFDTCEAGPACGHASSGFCSVGGRVRFYRDSDDGQEPSDPAKPVPNVRIALSGSNTGEAMTDADGRYTIAGAFGNVVTTPTRIDSFMQLTVSSQDAVQAAKHSVGSITLTPNQLIAADVTNNGEVSSFDASAIAKYAVGLLVPMGQSGDHFAVSAAHASDWSFQPLQYQHPLLAGPATTDDFVAIVYGDVTGNWTAESEEGPGSFAPLAAPAAAESPLAPRTGPAVLYLAEPPVRIAGTNDWKVVLGLRDADGILGLDIALRAGARLTLKSVQAVGIAQGFTALGNERAGKVALFAASSMRGSGAFLELVVRGSRAAIDRIGTTLSARANEGAIPIKWGTTDRGRRPNEVAPRVEGRP